MADLFVTNNGWFGDLQLTPSGDLQTVDGSLQGQQRVIRRVLTSPQALVFHPTYGFGLPLRIGQSLPASTLTGLLRAQMFQENAVSQSPPPTVTVQETPVGSGQIYANVSYSDAQSGAPMLLTFDVSQAPTTTTP